ncbi:hypothetical protein [Streptomyces sp. NPDC102409]|uniref:hypothetical protein n=1 Tax=Streptomyces sp. NPDC102409 TaxID=3366172 RepID=UPI00380548CC
MASTVHVPLHAVAFTATTTQVAVVGETSPAEVRDLAGGDDDGGSLAAPRATVRVLCGRPGLTQVQRMTA